MHKPPISSYINMGGNPFHEDRNTKMEDFYDDSHAYSEESANPIEDSYDFIDDTPTWKIPQPTYRHNGMSHSLSEGNIDFRSRTGQSKTSPIRHRRLASDEILTRYSEDDATSYSSPSRGATSSGSSRGRSFGQTPSPVRLENIKEASRSIEELSMSPQQRYRGRKQIFGQHGLLGANTSTSDLLSDNSRKRPGFKEWTGKLKERVEQLAPDIPKIDLASFAARLSSPSKSKSKAPQKTRFYVSLSPPLQARTYSEIELMIVASANEYLHTQQREGSMSVDSLARILEIWMSKNRPQVVEFLFDQATQRDLIVLNLRTFRFFGPSGDNLIAINRMLQQWRALARDMSVRNFCTPDPVVRKNLVDAFKVLEMLGAPMVTMLAFCDLKERVEKIITDNTQARREYEKIQFGVERKWEPEIGTVEGKEAFNPFP